MNKIIITNNYSEFITEDLEIKTLLWKSLRFRVNGYFHSIAYKTKVWDGFQDFFHKESGKFLTGLLPEVKMALKIKNIQYTLEDKREPIFWKYKTINNDFLNFGENPVKELRDYQINYVEQVAKHGRGLITSATGSGKTATMKAIIYNLPPKTPTLILANRKSLIDQNYEDVVSLGLDCGRVYGTKKDPKMITCSTSQSAKYLEPIFNKVKVLIVDEVHDGLTKAYKNVYKKLINCSVRIGMSATAFKFGGTDQVQKYETKGWFGPPFMAGSENNGKLTTKSLQEKGILSFADCKFYKIKEPKLPYALFLDAVTLGIAENKEFHNKVKNIVSKLKGRTLIVVDRIKHGDMLNELIPNSLWIRGQDTIETRKIVIDKLKYAEDVVAIGTSGIINTGINVFIHNLINAAGGKAQHNIIQLMGRGLRVSKDKEILNYIDFIFENNEYLERHSNIRIQTLKKEGHNVTIEE